jgi:hypothetical protein
LVLKTSHEHVPDRDGSEWPNEAAAHEEAVLVANDLMRNQNVKTRSWRIEVCDEDLRHCSELLFVEVDPTIAHLPPELRDRYIITSRRMAALSDAILAVRGTLADVIQTMGRADTVMAAVAGNWG